jgi:hypothetical protein
MRKFFAATRRASKNHVVLRRFFILRRQVLDGYQVFLIALLGAPGTVSVRRRRDCGNRPRCSIVARAGLNAFELGSASAWSKLRPPPADSIRKAMFGNWDRLVINRQSLRQNGLSMRPAASQRARLPIPCRQPNGSIFQMSACYSRMHAV